VLISESVAARVGSLPVQHVRGPSGRIDFRFARGGVVEGIVEAIGAPTPVEVVVRVVPEPEDSTAKFVRRIAEEVLPPVLRPTYGRFRLDPVPSGRFRLLASAEGFLETTTDLLEIRAGQVLQGVVVRLSPARRVVGRVVGPPGRPVRDAELVVEWDGVSGGAQFRGTLDVRVHPDGTFETSALLPGTYRFAARASRLFPAHATVEVGPAPVEPLVLELRPAGEVNGRVTDADGRTVRGTWLESIAPDGTREEAETDRFGYYSLDPLPPGPVVVRWRGW
jgi:hypothetical protein